MKGMAIFCKLGFHKWARFTEVGDGGYVLRLVVCERPNCRATK